MRIHVTANEVTYYGMAMSVKRICEVIMRNEKSILPVSHMIHGVYDIDGVSLSMPVIVGVDGIESNIPINLSGEEALKLKKSADLLEPGGIDHSESSRNNQSELIRNSQCTSLAN